MRRRSAHRGWKDQLGSRKVAAFYFQYRDGARAYSAWLYPADLSGKPKPTERIDIANDAATHKVHSGEQSIKRMLELLCNVFAEKQLDTSRNKITVNIEPGTGRDRNVWTAVAVLKR